VADVPTAAIAASSVMIRPVFGVPAVVGLPDAVGSLPCC
jgi:hypothetical protein